jgi:Arc/MetJ-type ribon-helix-helix transcriptional regulator
MVEKIKSIDISENLYNILRRKVELSDGEFENVDNYVEFLLRQLFGAEITSTLSEDDEKIIKERLKKLGYI